MAATVMVACGLVAALLLGAGGGAALAVSYTSEEIAVVQLINQYRVGNGLEALLISDLASDASEKHSKDMAKYGFVSHITVQSDWFPAGADWKARLVACGYPSDSSTGEIITAGPRSALEAFTAWKNSPTHNDIMLASQWRVIGIGVVDDPGSTYGVYWTADFGSVIDTTAHAPGDPSPADSTGPVAEIVSPPDGASVSGVVEVAVGATDDRAVARVELYVGGMHAGTDSSAPYIIAVDTGGIAAGTYLLQAEAYDTSGNVGVDSIVIHVTSVTTTTTTTSTTTTTTTSTTTSTSTTSSTTTSSTTSTTLPTTTTTTLPPPSTFSDVPPSHRFYEPISALTAAGVLSGYGDGTFHPDARVTRGQFAKIIVLALGRHTEGIDNGGEPTFSDVPYQGAAYPFDYVEEAVALKIIQGRSDGTFGPAENVTRLQLALMLVRAGGGDLVEPPPGYSCPFSDVPVEAREAIAVALYNELLSGKTATRFDPYGTATRGHVAKMVYGLAQALGL